MTEQDIDTIEARALASSDEWLIQVRGTTKHYGTHIYTTNSKNDIVIWGTSEDEYPDGDAAHSEREKEEAFSHWAAGGHYESVRDLANARLFINARDDILDLIREIKRLRDAQYQMSESPP